MKKVIMIPETNQEETKKPVEFTHYLDTSEGWENTKYKPKNFDKVFYLGKCDIDGDMFAVPCDGAINIFKGHLNSGEY